MYELDGRVCLYLSHYDTASLGRGLRCGVKVQLHNVHLVRLSAAPYRVGVCVGVCICVCVCVVGDKHRPAATGSLHTAAGSLSLGAD